MANRQNFTRPVKVEIVKRAINANGEPFCESCGAVGVPLELHHLRMDAMVPDEDKAKRKLTAADGQLWCSACHDPESKKQVARLAKAQRVEAAHLGIKPSTRRPIKSAGFQKRQRPHEGRAALPPRSLFK